MNTFTLYNVKGENVGTVEQPALFSVPVDPKLIHRYFLWVRTMLRPTLAHTKTRGEVRGGGRKPWRQKGTGRARVGSSRSPIWRTGGIVFGPTKDRNWETRMPRAERRKALLGAFSSKALAENVVVLDSWTMEAPKTREVVALQNTITPLTGKKVLHIHGSFDTNLFASTNNLPGFTSRTVQSVNIIDLLNHDVILFTQEGLTAATEHFTPSL